MKRNISKDVAQLVWLAAAIAVMVLASSVELLDHPPRNLPQAKQSAQPIASFNAAAPSTGEDPLAGPDTFYAQPRGAGYAPQR